MSRHIKILGWAYALLCGASLFVGVGLCVLFWPASNARIGAEILLFGPVLVLAAYTVPGLAGGIGLLCGQPWARPVLIVLSVLVLPAVPIGTAFGGYALWVLLGTRAQRGKSWTVLAGYGTLLLLAAGVAAGFAVALQVGFLWHDQAPPKAVEQAFPAALAVLVVLGLVLVSGGWTRLARAGVALPGIEGGMLPVWRRQRSLRDFNAMERERVARLGADPALRKYATLIRQGQPWSDAQIAYNEDPAHTATCVHLQPMERKMRAAGIVVRLLHGPAVQADCQIHLRQLTQEYGTEAAALYVERHDIDRSYHDPKTAMFWCPACQSNLGVVHPEEAGAATRWFPPLGAQWADR